ncbi:uncharacterized protein METZ01_LOCUS182943, partial [marine metagenome]
MVRILLFVTVLALGGGAFIAFSNVQGEMNRITADLDTAETELASTRGDLANAKKAQKEAEEKMAKAQDEAESAVARFRNAQQALVQQRQRAELHEAAAKKFEADWIQANAFSESWRQFQLANGTQDQIKEKLNAYRDVSNQRAQFLAENG